MKPVTVIVVIFLLLISAMHVLRIVFEFEIIVAGAVMPMWPSIAGSIVPVLLAVLLWRENRK